MATGIVVGDLNAVAEIGRLWGEGEGRCPRQRRKIAGSNAGARQVQAKSAGEGARAHITPTSAGEGARATQAVTGKRRGEMAEAAFLAKAAEMGFGIAKPWGDSDPFDFILHVSGKLWRVQVKSAHRAGEDGSYSFHAHGHALRAYGPKDIDALVAYVVPENAWYVFPVSLVRQLRSLKLFSGSRRKRSKFEKYREAWWVFREPVVGR